MRIPVPSPYESTIRECMKAKKKNLPDFTSLSSLREIFAKSMTEVQGDELRFVDRRKHFPMMPMLVRIVCFISHGARLRRYAASPEMESDSMYLRAFAAMPGMVTPIP